MTTIQDALPTDSPSAPDAELGNVVTFCATCGATIYPGASCVHGRCLDCGQPLEGADAFIEGLCDSCAGLRESVDHVLSLPHTCGGDRDCSRCEGEYAFDEDHGQGTFERIALMLAEDVA